MRAVSISCWIVAVLAVAAAPATADVAAERDVIARVAHLEELCARDPGRADCSNERRAQACTEVRSALRAAIEVAPPNASDLATDITLRLVRYVVVVIVDADCARPVEPDPDRGDDAIFREVLLERHALPVDLAGTVKTDLDVRAGNVRRVTATVRNSAEWFAGFAAKDEVEMFDIDGKAVPAEPVIRGMCVSLPDEAGALLDEYAAFDDRFSGVPAARYAHDRLTSEAFNALALTWEALLMSETCAEYAPVLDSWRVGLRFVKPGERLTPPADPATRFVGTAAATAEAGVAGRLDELRDLLTHVTGNRRETVCATLGRRLADEFAPAWRESRRVSREAHYHFVDERAHQLSLLREAHDATMALADSCGMDVDPAPWREDYLRHVVAFVELLEPPLAATLSRYLGSRFDVDMERGR